MDEKIDEVTALLDAVASDDNVSRANYREFLESVASDIETRLMALDEDDARDGVK